jgi:hypothetical protein
VAVTWSVLAKSNGEAGIGWREQWRYKDDTSGSVGMGNRVPLPTNPGHWVAILHGRPTDDDYTHVQRSRFENGWAT